MSGGKFTKEVEVKQDMRSPLAKARYKWFESYEGRRCLTSGMAWGPYLKNRLELAFIAGWEAAMKSERKKSGPNNRGGKGKEE